MCGLAGLLCRDGVTPPDPGDLARMSAAVAHRGPDGHGCHRDGPVAIAIRRLAIVDVPGGDQPLASEDGRIHVVCNGEIYNHARLRAGLARRGHRFRTRSDCEVLAHLYEERGPEFVSLLRGMFALALWDAREQRLLLARDHFGIKPLLYALDDRRLAFSSELQGLTALPDVSREIDPDALSTYLTVNAVMGERTMLRAVRRLRPGHLLIADPAGVRTHRYARDLPGAERPRTPDEVRQQMRESVTAHLQGDVEVGVLLSGGVDSGLIAALAAEKTPGRLKTFSVGFAEPAFDERDRARLVARRYDTDHAELVVGPDAAGELAAVAKAFDEPRGDATALPYWLAAREAARHVKVALSGEGGDELFGGYQTYQADLLGPRAARAAALLAPAAAALPASAGRLPLTYKLRRLARGAGLPAMERHHAFKEIFGADERAALLGSVALPASAGRLRADDRAALLGAHDGDPLAEYRARYAESAGADPIARMQDLDVGTFLADDLLVQTDRAGMAHGLEIRVPFIDPEVARLALALPRQAKVSRRHTKLLLRAAAAPLLPQAIVRGPKRGFCAPAAAWLRGPLLPLATDVLGTDTLRRQGIFRPDAVHAVLARHTARREDASRQVWALIAFTLWHDAHVTAPAEVRPDEAIASAAA